MKGLNGLLLVPYLLYGIYTLVLSPKVDAFVVKNRISIGKENRCDFSESGKRDITKLSNQVDDEGNDQVPEKTPEEEAEDLQKKINELVAPSPMFSPFGRVGDDNPGEQESLIPVPLFTAIAVAIYSIVWTYQLYDIGINGF